MEISSDKSPLVHSNKSSHKSNSPRKYIIVIIFCICVIVTLLILNLWQAGYLDTATNSNKINNKENCNGNGMKYDDINICECYECYQGEECEQEIEDCIISAGSGQPFLMVEYWKKMVQTNKINPIHIPIDYRCPYEFTTRGVFYPTSNDSFPERLSQIIRKIHKKYHNVDIDGKYMVFGVGAAQLTTAAYIAWSRIKGEQIIAFDEIPYYFGYLKRCSAATLYHCTFNSSYNLYEGVDNIREIVTIPNNPTGFERERWYANQSSYGLDLVYYWPQFYDSNDDLEAKNAPLSLFSFTKLSGHAATRFGWAVIDSFELAEEMNRYIEESLIHISIDSFRRAWDILSYIQENGDDYFDFIRGRLKERWKIFLNILDGQDNYILHSKIGTQYGWIECVNKTDDDAISELFQSYGISPYRGDRFGQPGYVRLNLCEFEGNFQKIMDRFKQLVDDER